MIFKVAVKKANKNLVKLVMDGKDTWCACTEAVVNWARKSFKEGDEVNAEMDGQKDGMPNVTRITKVGQSSSAPEKKTYTPTKSYAKSPDTQDMIVRQSCMRGACQAVTALTGTLENVDVLANAVKTLYDELYAKVNS